MKFTASLHEPTHYDFPSFWRNLELRQGAPPRTECQRQQPRALSKGLSSKLFALPAARPRFTDSETEPWGGGASSLGPPACPPAPGPGAASPPRYSLMLVLLVNSPGKGFLRSPRKAHGSYCATDALLPLPFYFLAETLLSGILCHPRE